MPAALMLHESDPKKALLDKIGDVTDAEVFNIQILVATYLRPERTKGGLYLPESNRDEDRYQGKVGLVVKLGPSACDAKSQWFDGIDGPISVGDWIVYRPSDGWPVTVNEVPCRMLEDTDARMRIQHPDMVW